MTHRTFFALIIVLMLPSFIFADSPAEKLLKRPDAWFRSDEGLATIKNILSWQTEYGDWPKNSDTTQKEFTDDKKPSGTFDNGATTGELRVLARAFRITGTDSYRQAFLRGFDHILAAQYDNGGWPQYFPLSTKYHRHITFNDDTMVRLMWFLRDTTTEEDFQLLDENRRSSAEKAIERGIDCIVKCQIVVDGKLTVWCAQHDADTLAPTLARTYELPSLSGAESAGNLKFLMSIEDPTPDVIRAIKAGIAWYNESKIHGYRYQSSDSREKLREDPDAEPLWARFYEIGTNRPIFCDRDGIVKYNLNEISSERRNGYAWYGTWGSSVLKMYADWPHR